MLSMPLIGERERRGMEDIVALLGRWELTAREARERMYRAPTPRERERWHVVWLLAQGWSANTVANLVERDPHTIGSWLAAFAQDGPATRAFEQTGGSPPARDPDTQAGLKVAVQAAPSAVGIDLANRNWQAVRQFTEARCGLRLSRSSCLRYLHRLGFVCMRPKKRLLTADEAKRAVFVEEYAALLAEAEASRVKIFFADEAHFRADGDLRAKWVLKGRPPLGDSTCPRWGEKASDYSAVCLETGEVEHRALTGTSNALTSAAFLQQLRAARRAARRDLGQRPGARRRRDARLPGTPPSRAASAALPPYSPDCNLDEAIWAWAREEATANTCLGTKEKVQERMAQFFAGLATHTVEVQSRRRRKLQALAEGVAVPVPGALQEGDHAVLTCASV